MTGYGIVRSHLAFPPMALTDSGRIGELYGFERLEDLFSTTAQTATATAVTVNFGQDDDITVLTLTRLTTGEEPGRSTSSRLCNRDYHQIESLRYTASHRSW